MHALEKILASHAGVNQVVSGEIIKAKIDLAEVNDLYLQTIYSFYEMGGKKVWDKDKVCFVFDHYAPAPTIKTAQIYKEMRQFVEQNNLTHHFDINTGVSSGYARGWLGISRYDFSCYRFPYYYPWCFWMGEII
ncbi:MAG: hypothetical protein JM58_01255 [Peptococcaceae bacterium BICA1-8]|nr:MAG: hypothetical protein JM58_01255 [Peptococcaceae bacterium BICA1-8]